MDDFDAANMAFSTSLMLWRQSPDAWVSWGRYCDASYEKMPQGPSATRNLQYAAHCYLQGLRLGAEEARDLLPRLLHLLCFDEHEGKGGGRGGTTWMGCEGERIRCWGWAFIGVGELQPGWGGKRRQATVFKWVVVVLVVKLFVSPWCACHCI